MKPSAIVFPIFAILVLMVGLDRATTPNGFDEGDGIGLAIGFGLGFVATGLSLWMQRKAALSKATKGTELTTALFGSMMIKFAGGAIIYSMERFTGGQFDLFGAFSSYLAVVFLGFAFLPKLVQAPTNEDTDTAPNRPANEPQIAEKQASAAHEDETREA